MSHKQKLGYMALGALIMLIGMGVGSTFFTPHIEAQQNGVFDTITCRELKVVDKNGQQAIELNGGAGNYIVIFNNKNGQSAIELGSLGANNIMICDENGKKAIGLKSFRGGNSIDISDQNGKVAFEFNAYTHTNELSVHNKSDGAGIGFYADYNEAKQTTWRPKQKE